MAENNKRVVELAPGIHMTRDETEEKLKAAQEILEGSPAIHSKISSYSPSNTVTDSGVTKYELDVMASINRRAEALSSIREQMSARTKEKRSLISSTISSPLMKVSETFAKRGDLVKGTTIFHRIVNRVGSKADLLAKRFQPVRNSISELHERISSATVEAVLDIEIAEKLFDLHQTEVKTISMQMEQVREELSETLQFISDENEKIAHLTEGTPEHHASRHRIAELERLATRLDRMISNLNIQVAKAEGAADRMRNLQDGIVSEIDTLNQAAGTVSSASQTLDDMALMDNSKGRIELTKGVAMFAQRVELSAARQDQKITIERAHEIERPALSHATLRRIRDMKQNTNKKVKAITDKASKERDKTEALIADMRTKHGLGSSISAETRQQIHDEQQKRLGILPPSEE